jgi:hypothetical protein
MDRYGGLLVHPVGDLTGVLEPIHYRATTPTRGTGIAISSAARTTWVATESTCIFRNTAGAGGKYVIPLWVRLIYTNAGTVGTNAQWGLILDTINRYTSGGTTLSGATGANSAKSDASDTPVCTVYGGALTTAAASAPRQMGRGTSITRAAATAHIVGDEVLFTFGAVGNAGYGVLAATAGRYVVPFGQVAIAPGHSAVLHYWSAAQTGAPQAEYEVAWMEL